jgi:hypothetical protein
MRRGNSVGGDALVVDLEVRSTRKRPPVLVGEGICTEAAERLLTDDELWEQLAHRLSRFADENEKRRRT